MVAVRNFVQIQTPHTRTCTHAHTCTHTRTHTLTHMHTYIHIHTNTDMYVCVFVRVRVCVRVHLCIRACEGVFYFVHFVSIYLHLIPYINYVKLHGMWSIGSITDLLFNWKLMLLIIVVIGNCCYW